MSTHTTAPTVPAADSAAPETADEVELDALDGLVEEDLLVEDVSIDGMCGVY